MHPPQLLTASQLARRVDCAWLTLARILVRGEIVPDFQSGTTRLFRPEKVDLLRARLHPDGKTDTIQS